MKTKHKLDQSTADESTLKDFNKCVSSNCLKKEIRLMMKIVKHVIHVSEEENKEKYLYLCLQKRKHEAHTSSLRSTYLNLAPS